MPVTKILASDIDLKDQSLTTTKTEFEDDDLVTAAFVEQAEWKRSWFVHVPGRVSEGYHYCSVEFPLNLSINKITVSASGECCLDFLFGDVGGEKPYEKEYYKFSGGNLRKQYFSAQTDLNKTNYIAPFFSLGSEQCLCVHVFAPVNCFDLKITFDFVRHETYEAPDPGFWEWSAPTSEYSVSCPEVAAGNSSLNICYDETNNKVLNMPWSDVDKKALIFKPEENTYYALSLPEIVGFDRSTISFGNYQDGCIHRSGKIYYFSYYADIWVIVDLSNDTFSYKTTAELSNGAISSPIGLGSSFTGVSNFEGEIYFFPCTGFGNQDVSGTIYKIDKRGVLERRDCPDNFYLNLGTKQDVWVAGGDIFKSKKFGWMYGKIMYYFYSGSIGNTGYIGCYDYRNNDCSFRGSNWYSGAKGCVCVPDNGWLIGGGHASIYGSSYGSLQVIDPNYVKERRTALFMQNNFYTTTHWRPALGPGNRMLGYCRRNFSVNGSTYRAFLTLDLDGSYDQTWGAMGLWSSYTAISDMKAALVNKFNGRACFFSSTPASALHFSCFKWS